MREGLLLAVALLGACSGPITRDEAYDIADDAVDGSELGGSVRRLESRIAELESEVVDLKQENAARATAIARLHEIGSSEHKWAEENFDALFKNDAYLSSTINQGRTSVP